MMGDPPDDAIDPGLVAELDRGHTFAPTPDGRTVCLACASERSGRRYRAHGAPDWSPFPPACIGLSDGEPDP